MFRPAFILLFLIYFLSITQAQEVTNYYAYRSFGQLAGSTNLLINDLNKDGLTEIIFSGQRENADLVYVANMRGRNIKPKWNSHTYAGDQKVAAILIYNVNQDDHDDILVILKDGKTDVYDGLTLELVKTFETGFSMCNRAVIGDADNDGFDDELIMISDSKTMVYDPVNESIVWENTDFKGKEIKIGDVDGDNQHELVIGHKINQPGLVIDSKTQTIEWSFIQGFKENIELSDINNDGAAEIFSISESGNVVVLNAKLKSPLFDFNRSRSLSSISLGRLLSL